MVFAVEEKLSAPTVEPAVAIIKLETESEEIVPLPANATVPLIVKLCPANTNEPLCSVSVPAVVKLLPNVTAVLPPLFTVKLPTGPETNSEETPPVALIIRDDAEVATIEPVPATVPVVQ